MDPRGGRLAEDVHRIRRFVDALVRRERALLVVRVAARAALLLLGVFACMVLASVIRVDRGAATMTVVTAAGIGGWIAVALPLLLEWRPTGDPLRQARRVEALRPELRGRLVTAVGHQARADESDALLALVVRRAAAALQGVGTEHVHDARPALRWAAIASVLWAVGLPILLLSSSPGGVLKFWLGGGTALADVAGLQIEAPEDLARVGDIVIRYTYPDYTGLDPKVVPNSTGDVQAPPGTVVEVTARSADVVEAAGLVAYGDALEAALTDEGREVAGRFSIRADEGAYHVVLYRGGASERSRDFKIVPQEDLPPEVMLDAGPDEVLEISVDESVPLQWQARDDYGVRKVGMALDGRDLDRVLARPDHRQAEIGERLYVSPRELGLKPGDRARLSVVAWDNDTVSGSKRGMSREVELVVLGARGLAAKAAERRDELLAKMIPILARYLTEPWPAGDSSGDLAKYGEVVSGRYQPLVDAVEDLWSGMATDTHDRAVAQRVVDTGRDLVRYTQVSFLPDSPELAREDAVAMTAELRDEAIVALEDGILAFHRMQRNDALRELAIQAKDLEQMAKRMAETLEQEDPDAQELLARLDALERMMEQLREKAARLDQSEGLREYLNMRENEARHLMDEIRQAIAEGRMDEARELMERLSQLVEEMGQGIQDELERRMQQGDDASDMAGELKDELEALAEEQRKLQSEVQALREQDEASTEQLGKLWEELARLAAAHRRSAEGYVRGLEEGGRAFFERERAAAGVEEAAEIESAVAARDPRGARQAVGSARGAWGMARRAYESEAGHRRGLQGPGRRELLQLHEQLEEIERLLEQMERQGQQLTPEAMEQAQQLEGRQRDLDNRLQQARQQAQELERQFPVKPQGMQEALEDAGERMQGAADDLRTGRPMEAEGSMGVAGQRIEDAIEALEQAQQQAQQQQQQLQPGQEQEGEDKPDEGESDGQDHNRTAIEIPGREEFRTPEEYRRALLEGMEGDVPEEYRAMKRRYYEELVHQ